jgi:hypothetical protein
MANFFVPSDAEKALLIAKISIPTYERMDLDVFAKSIRFGRNGGVFATIENRRKILKSSAVFSKVISIFRRTDSHNIEYPVIFFQLTPFSASWAEKRF